MKTCPNRSVDGGDHVGAGGMPHAFAKPHDLFDKVMIKARLFDCAIDCR